MSQAADDDAPASAGFAQLVSALQAPPAPVRRRARGPAAEASPAPTAESTDAQLERAEACSRSGRIDEAVEICAALRPALVAEGDPQRVGWCDFVLALSHLNAGRAKEAVVAGYRAVGALPHGARLLRALVILACSVARTGDAAGALTLLDRAHVILPDIAHSPRDRCLFWLNSGGTYHALGDLAQAVRHSTLAQGLLPEFEDPHLHSVVQMNLLVQRLVLAVAGCGGVLTPELSELLAAFESRIDALVVAGHHFPVAKGSEDVADAWIALGRHDKAREALLVGVRSADAVKARPDRGILEIRLARIERLAGQYRRASAHISLALELLAEGELIKELADAHLENCLLHEERQHHRAALDSHRQFAALRERLLVAQSDARAHALTTRYEFELARLQPH
jgi:tetratricopeptide (TPR) repeat protein